MTLLVISTSFPVHFLSSTYEVGCWQHH